MAQNPTPEQKAQLWLTTTLAAQRKVAVTPVHPDQRGKAVAEQPPRPDARHTQALVNAVAVGPGRASRQERWLALARLLAQRVTREDDKKGPWARLSQRVTEEIERFEQQSQRAKAQVERSPLQLDSAQLTAGQQEVTMQSVEEFLHALNRAVNALSSQDAAHNRPSDRMNQIQEENQGEDHDN